MPCCADHAELLEFQEKFEWIIEINYQHYFDL